MSEYPSKERIEAEFDGGTPRDEVIAGLSWELAKRQRQGELQDTGWMDVVESVRKYLEED